MTIFHKTFSHLKSFPRAMWVVCLASFLNQMGFMAFPFLLLYLTKHVGLSLVQASFVFIVYGSSLIFTSFIAGNIVDRIGPEKTLISALIANSVIMFIFVFLHHYHAILINCVLWGITFGAIRPATQTLISFLSHPDNQKITFSVYRFFINLGVSIGPAIGGFLVMKSFLAIFIANGFSNIIAAIILFFGLKSVKYKSKKHLKTLSIIESLAILKTDKIYRIFLIGTIIPVMIFFLHEGPLPVYLVDDLHFSYPFYGMLFTINTLIIVFFEILLNVAMESFSHRSSLMIGGAVMTLGFFGLAWFTSSAGIIFMAILWTIGEMIFFPASNALVADIAPAHMRGSYMGLYNMFQNFSMILGLWLGTFVMHYIGGKNLWIISGIWGLLSLLFFIRLPSRLSKG